MTKICTFAGWCVRQHTYKPWRFRCTWLSTTAEMDQLRSIKLEGVPTHGTQKSGREPTLNGTFDVFRDGPTATGLPIGETVETTVLRVARGSVIGPSP